ncbi:MAG: hypothetical protein H7Y06_00015, partial [Opitutaceae bacterium]|nr:hypothetical protein [Opitutaceae bacterium]
ERRAAGGPLAAGGEWTACALRDAADTSLTDPGLYPDTEYTYRIRPLGQAEPAPFWTASAAVRTPEAEPAARANGLAEDFSDGERATQSLPASSAWYFGSQNAAATLTATGGALSLNQSGSTSSTLAATTYFTAAGSPLSLEVGQAIVLRFDLALVLGGSSLNEGLRFGLYHSGGSRRLSDSTANNGADAAYNAWPGYTVFTTLGTNTGGAFTLRRRNQSNSTLVAAAAHTAVGAGVAAPSLIDGATYADNSLTFTRTATGLTLRARLAGVTLQVEDLAGPPVAFDAFGIWAHPTPLGSQGRVRLDNLSVEKVTLADLPQRAWRRTHFGTPEAAGTSADLADPDGDGLPNLLEYALGRAPLNPASSAAPATDLGPDSRLRLSFLRAAADLDYAVEGSSDLADWTALAINPGSPGDQLTVADTVAPGPSAPRRFLRLFVTLRSL